MRRVIAVALVLIAAPAAAQQRPNAAVTSSIVTIGNGTVRRPPDLALVTLTVEARASAPREAQQQNAKKMAAVTTALAGGGVARDALQTVGVRLQQEFDMPGGRRTPAGFLATNSVEVRLTDPARAGDVADTAIAAGATRLDGISFDLRDRAAAEREALRLAVVDARGKADAAAAGIGRSVDRILRIEEEGADGRSRALPALLRMPVGGVNATSVEPGFIVVNASVLLTVSIK